MSAYPLVSIGIPTYNRPEGLKRTLEFITSQSYHNIQVIVSDNCSTDSNVKKVVEEFSKNDPRITFFRQPENIGVLSNFKFVLEQASGEYFFWAADDDEWHPDFITRLLPLIGDRSAAFCNYFVKYPASNTINEIVIKQSASGKNKFCQAKNFLLERVPSMFYGIFKTKDIKWFVHYKKSFDWLDCFVIFRTIVLGNGYVLDNQSLYTAGIKGSSYRYHPIYPSKSRLFTYKPYFIESVKVIFQSEMSFLQKLKLFLYFFDVNYHSFIRLEINRKRYGLYHFGYRFYNKLGTLKKVKKLY